MSLTRFVATLLLVGLAAPALAQSDRPNIVFIFSDDHAYQAIGAYGSRINQTPNIDRIAREGMRFENAMVTNSICAPSRAVIQTGKYSHLNGVLDNRQVFDGSQQTFPKLLQQAGYQTAMVGKWHLKSEPTGFDYWEVLPGQGSYYNPDFRVPGGEKRHYGYVTDIITDLTLAWLEDGRDPDRPFMVMTQNKAPHRGWMSGPDKLTLYDGVTIPEPDTLFDDYANRASPARLQEMEIGRHMIDGHDMKLKPPPGTPEDAPGQQLWLAGYGRLDERQRRVWDAAYEPKNAAFMAAGLEGRDLVRWKYQRYIKDYLRTIASVDDNVGRILEDGRDPDRPFMVMTQNKAPHRGWMSGPVPILQGETPSDWRTSFYYHYYEHGVHNVAPHEGVRTERQKLIHYYETDEWELFDLATDPNEMRSVYGDETYSDTHDALLAELERLKADVGVPGTP